MIIVKDKEEFAGCRDDLGVRMLTALPNSIDSLIVVPNVAFVHFDHDAHRATSGVLIRLLEQRQDKVLKLFIDAVVLGCLVDSFQVRDDNGMQIFSECFILALKQLKEDW